MNLLRLLFGQSQRDLDEEIRRHLEMAEQDLVNRGQSSDEARAAALRQFVNVALVKDVTSATWGWTQLEQIGRDLKCALRQLRKAPGFALAVILTLALGIGLNTAIFSMVNGFILRRPPFPQPDRIAALITHEDGISSRSGKQFSEDDDSADGTTWNLVREGVPSVEAAAYGLTSGVNLEAGSGADKTIRYVHSGRVSAAYFDVLGIQPVLGRSFTLEEDRPNGPPAVILSHALWRSAFHADPNILGKAVKLKGEPHSVVGILPENAHTTQVADLWTPLQPSTSGEGAGNNYGILMRLRPGATWQQADAQLSHLHLPAFDELASNAKGHGWFYAEPLTRYLGKDQRQPVLFLMMAVAFILMIACTNLAGLTLVRFTRRMPEIAVRLSLGASRWAIFRQLWIESLSLAFLGAGVGLLLAHGILTSLTRLLIVYAIGFGPDFVPIGGFTMDAPVLAFTFAISLLASLLFGALPAMMARRVDLRSSIASGSPAVASGSARSRQWLIAGEVALTVVLLTAAGLLVRTLIYLETLPAGFDATNVLTAKASLDDLRYNDATRFHALLERSVEAMRQMPGVEDAAVGLSVPYERGLNDGIRIVDGKLANTADSSSTAWVTPGYFHTLRIPVLAGRGIEDSDTERSARVAVVNAAFAQHFYHDPRPIGRHFETEGKLLTIVGVVSNVTKRPGESQDAPLSTEPVFYLAAAQTGNIGSIWFQPSWIVRTRAPIAGLPAAMQRALSQVAPDLPFSGFYSMQELLAENLIYQRIEALLLGSLASLALVLSAIGIYGLVSNVVTQRTREIGIRIALGSSLREAMVRIGWSGIVAAVAGIAGGLALSFAVVPALRSEIYGIRSYDPLTLVTVPLVLTLIAAAASLLPTLRIARIDPAKTLRSE